MPICSPYSFSIEQREGNGTSVWCDDDENNGFQLGNEFSTLP